MQKSTQNALKRVCAAFYRVRRGSKTSKDASKQEGKQAGKQASKLKGELKRELKREQAF